MSVNPLSLVTSSSPWQATGRSEFDSAGDRAGRGAGRGDAGRYFDHGRRGVKTSSAGHSFILVPSKNLTKVAVCHEKFRKGVPAAHVRNRVQTTQEGGERGRRVEESYLSFCRNLLALSGREE